MADGPFLIRPDLTDPEDRKLWFTGFRAVVTIAMIDSGHENMAYAMFTTGILVTESNFEVHRARGRIGAWNAALVRWRSMSPPEKQAWEQKVRRLAAEHDPGPDDA